MLLEVEQGICFSLNPVGLRIWKLLKERRSVDQIVDALAQGQFRSVSPRSA